MEPRARLAAVLGTCVVGLVAALLWSGSATSCASRSTEPEVAGVGGRPEGRCAVTLGPSDFEPVAPTRESDAPTSRVVVELAVAEAALERILDARIPKGLGAATRQPIGTPGELSYSVSRGEPDATLVGDTLEVKLPIVAAVEVCKPIGRLCPIYGTCQPSLVATTRVPLRLGEDYAVDPPTVEVRVTRGCRIAGFDVTGEVQSAAAGARRRAEREIAAAIPDVRALLDEAMKALARPVAVDDERCLRIVPRAVRQGDPTSREGTLGASLELEGTVEDAPCDARFPAPELPRLARRRGPARPSELVTRHLVGGELADRLRPRGPAEVDLRPLRVRPHRTAEGPRLALEIEVDGPTCGRLWALGDPHLDDDALVLRELEPTSDAPAGLLDGIELAMEGVGEDDLARRLVDRLRAASSGLAVEELAELALRIDLGAVDAQAAVTADGVAIVTRASGRLRIVVASADTR